ncbi:LytR/AlgR family response regulator transcription factor [Tenuifilum thalassicum]|uniref:Response regulator transcription factor n=1 Tax=Tenuifilum thalassicum TaxID=2590900 RepID=A0A7D4BD25_9BACT|nr:LytTR family DNA-binding domain-containing protein [Tenuifilum thalassicum]QKG79323.1 response regulator transcription factor [Tenuifilum thalassicum]
MSRITCIAIDDEPIALAIIVSHIKKIPYLDLLAEFDNPVDALEFLQDNKVQLIFLDINMPDLSGVEFARALDKNCKIIFTTAHDKYAIEGFQLHALDYLLKPISFEVFAGSVLHAKEYFDLLNAGSADRQITADLKYLFVKAGYQIHKVDFDNILYFEGLKDYVKLYTKGSLKPIVFYSTMKALEEKLPPDLFMRIHRSYIVALNEIETIEHDRIIFGDKRIPISKQYKPLFEEFLKKKFL